MQDILTAIGGTAVVIVGLSSWLGKVWATRIANQEAHKFQIQFDAIKREKNLLFEALKSAILRYSDKQFALYNELWRSLCELKASADDLWEEVNFQKVKTFAKQVKEAKDAIERNALLIEDHHYTRIKRIISQFEEFEFEKKRLVDLRSMSARSNDLDPYTIRNTIENNRQIKDQYTQLLVDLCQNFKSQIRGETIF
jgi:hypothetical protein